MNNSIEQSSAENGAAIAGQAERCVIGWHPIETAPDDEMLLLAVEFDGPGDWRIKVGYKDKESYTGWKVFGASWKPTRWALLPEPPDNAKANPRSEAESG